MNFEYVRNECVMFRAICDAISRDRHRDEAGLGVCEVIWAFMMLETGYEL